MTVATHAGSRGPSHPRDERPLRDRRRPLAALGALLVVALTLVAGAVSASPLPGVDPCAGGPRPVTMIPALTSIMVGTQADDLVSQAPVLLANDAGYFTDAGFTTPVGVMVVQEPLPACSTGSSPSPSWTRARSPMPPRPVSACASSRASRTRA